MNACLERGDGSIPAETSEADRYWIERRSAAGGWHRQYRGMLIEEEPDRPESNDDWWILDGGEYRCIARIDKRYGPEIWRYETEDAADVYERERRALRVHSHLARHVAIALLDASHG